MNLSLLKELRNLGIYSPWKQREQKAYCTITCELACIVCGYKTHELVQDPPILKGLQSTYCSQSNLVQKDGILGKKDKIHFIMVEQNHIRHFIALNVKQ